MVILMKKAFKKINLDAILYNYRHLKCEYKKNIIAVLKDDAYGMGLVKVAKILQNEDKIIFAVKDLKEALILRKNNIKNDILILGIIEKENIKKIKKYDLTVIISSFEQLSFIKNTNVKFHIKIDTGMNRIGFSISDFNTVLNKIKEEPNNYCFTGVMSHFATEDKNHKQYNVFCKCLENIDTSNLIVHCLSSNSLFLENKTNYARVGLRLYGFYKRDLMLKNCMELYAPIVLKKQVKKDELVGYDFLFKTPQDGYLYILPIGYASGWGRFKKSFAFTPAYYLKQAGNISMDYSAYFSTQNIKKDTILELISLNAPLEHLANLNDISIYELLVKIKVKRYYL